jgi:hypothetical protein
VEILETKKEKKIKMKNKKTSDGDTFIARMNKGSASSSSFFFLLSSSSPVVVRTKKKTLQQSEELERETLEKLRSSSPHRFIIRIPRVHIHPSVDCSSVYTMMSSDNNY